MKESHFVSKHKTFAWCKKSTCQAHSQQGRPVLSENDKKIFKVSFQALRKTNLTFLLEKLDEGLGKLAVLFATGKQWDFKHRERQQQRQRELARENPGTILRMLKILRADVVFTAPTSKLLKWSFQKTWVNIVLFPSFKNIFSKLQARMAILEEPLTRSLYFFYLS